MTVIAKANLNLWLQQTKQADLTTLQGNVLKDLTYSLIDGTGAGKADTLFHDTRTTSGNDDLDIVGGLTDALGNTVSILKIKGLVVQAAAANTTNVVIGGSATNPVTSFMTGTTPAVLVRPGGMFALLAGVADATAYAATAATADILRISAASGSVTYDVYIWGTSA